MALDLEKLEQEYGLGPDSCSFCGGLGGIHQPLTRMDGRTTRCQVGDVRVLTHELRTSSVSYRDGLQLLADAIPKECRHGRDIHGSCAICDQVDPLNCALEEVEHFLRKIENGYPAAREEATDLLERIRQFKDEAV